MTSFSQFSSVCFATALLAVPARADVFAEGFEIAALPQQPGASMLELSSGDLLIYDGSTVDRLDSDGVFVETVYALPGSFFGGCFAVNPSETKALVGESTNGDLFVVDLGANTGAPLGNMAFNFAAAFESDSSAIVSAATCGIGCGNALIRIDLGTGAQTPLANVAGASGPVAIAADGDLFYGTSSASFPAPIDATSILRFDSASLTGAPVLDESDATVIVDELDGAFSMDYDPATGRIYFGENHFGTGLNRLLAIDAGSGAIDVLVDGTAFDFMSGVQFVSGSGPGVVAPFQPGTSGHVVYTDSDFFTFDDRRAVVPARANLALSGPGTGGGAGAVDLAVTGGPAAGFAVLAACPLGNLATSETAYVAGGLPLILTALNPVTTVFEPVPLALDGAGNGSVSFANHAGLVDVFAVQGLLVDAGITSVIATTTTDTL